MAGKGTPRLGTSGGFVLGDHTFLVPGVAGPASRLRAPKKAIRGAIPPTYLDGLVRESSPKSPAAVELFRGKFCGHAEPTMAIFDLVIEGEQDLEVSVIAPEDEGNVPLMVARRPGGSWFTLFRRTWEDEQNGLVGVRQSPPTKKEEALFRPHIRTGRVSIGFEYPCDADSRDSVSWLTIDALFEPGTKPLCAVDAEMA
ncbi:MAG: hypothetical protein HUU19_14825 [Phycisphaerales bacterium]|nr:hypothetical protein [Phycisphaerales bacterium]